MDGYCFRKKPIKHVCRYPMLNGNGVKKAGMRRIVKVKCKNGMLQWQLPDGEEDSYGIRAVYELYETY